MAEIRSLGPTQRHGGAGQLGDAPVLARRSVDVLQPQVHAVALIDQSDALGGADARVRVRGHHAVLVGQRLPAPVVPMLLAVGACGPVRVPGRPRLSSGGSLQSLHHGGTVCGRGSPDPTGEKAVVGKLVPIVGRHRPIVIHPVRWMQYATVQGDSIVIRPAEPEDAAGVQAIYAPIVEHTVISFEYDIPSVDEMRRRIEHTTATWPWLVAE